MKNKYVYIIAALAVILLLISIEIRHQTDIQHIGTLTAENAELKQDITWLRYTNDQRATTIEMLTNVLKDTREADTEVQQTKVPEAQKTNRSGEHLTSLGTYTVTAYCSCEKCCGEYAKNRPGGKVYGAAGVELTPGISVAGWLPLGTQIMIDGHEYIVQDRTAKWVKEKYDGRIIDIYFDDHEAALEWGRQSLEVCKID